MKICWRDNFCILWPVTQSSSLCLVTWQGCGRPFDHSGHIALHRSKRYGFIRPLLLDTHTPSYLPTPLTKGRNSNSFLFSPIPFICLLFTYVAIIAFLFYWFTLFRTINKTYVHNQKNNEFRFLFSGHNVPVINFVFIWYLNPYTTIFLNQYGQVSTLSIYSMYRFNLKRSNFES